MTSPDEILPDKWEKELQGAQDLLDWLLRQAREVELDTRVIDALEEPRWKLDEVDVVAFWAWDRVTRGGIKAAMEIMEGWKGWGLAWESPQEPFLSSAADSSTAEPSSRSWPGRRSRSASGSPRGPRRRLPREGASGFMWAGRREPRIADPGFDDGADDWHFDFFETIKKQFFSKRTTRFDAKRVR